MRSVSDRKSGPPRPRSFPVLELAVLGLLSEQPLHGYELKKRLSETLGPLWGSRSARCTRRCGGSNAPARSKRPSRRRRPGRHSCPPARSRATSPPPASGAGPAPGCGPARPTASRPRASSCSSSSSPTRPPTTNAPSRRSSRSAGHLERRRSAWRSSSAGAPSSRSAWPRPAATPPAARIVTPGRSSSTGPSPPNTISTWIEELIAQERDATLHDRTEGATA